MSTTLTTPRQLYRRYLKNLCYLPDPHVWSVLVPEFKPTSENQRTSMPRKRFDNFVQPSRATHTPSSAC